MAFLSVNLPYFVTNRRWSRVYAEKGTLVRWSLLTHLPVDFENNKKATQTLVVLSAILDHVVSTSHEASGHYMNNRKQPGYCLGSIYRFFFSPMIAIKI